MRPSCTLGWVKYFTYDGRGNEDKIFYEKSFERKPMSSSPANGTCNAVLFFLHDLRGEQIGIRRTPFRKHLTLRASTQDKNAYCFQHRRLNWASISDAPGSFGGAHHVKSCPEIDSELSSLKEQQPVGVNLLTPEKECKQHGTLRIDYDCAVQLRTITGHQYWMRCKRRRSSSYPRCPSRLPFARLSVSLPELSLSKEDVVERMNASQSAVRGLKLAVDGDVSGRDAGNLLNFRLYYAVNAGYCSLASQIAHDGSVCCIVPRHPKTDYFSSKRVRSCAKFLTFSLLKAYFLGVREISVHRCKNPASFVKKQLAAGTCRLLNADHSTEAEVEAALVVSTGLLALFRHFDLCFLRMLCDIYGLRRTGICLLHLERGRTKY